MPPEWGMLVVFNFFLAGIASGAFFLAALADIFGDERDREIARVGYILPLPLVIIGLILLVLHLGSPLRFYRMLTNFKLLSPMSVGAWAWVVFFLFSLASFIMALGERERYRDTSIGGIARTLEAAFSRRLIGAVGAPVGIFMASYQGVLLGATSLPLWAEARLLGALFFTYAILTGAAAVYIVLASIGVDYGPADKLRKLSNWAIVVNLFFLLFLLVTLGTSPRATGTLGDLIGGIYGVFFWVFVVAVGLLIPLIMAVRSGIRGVAPSRPVLMAILILVGGFFFRFVIVMAGQA